MLLKSNACFCLFLVLFLCVTLVFPVFAGNTIILNYEPWLFFYDLEDNDENHNLWMGMYSYGGSEELYPIHVDEDVYNEKLLSSEVPDAESENSGDFQPDSDEPALSDGDSISSNLHSDAAQGYSEAALVASGAEPSLAQSLATVPTNGQSYIQPQVVAIEYAADATSGTLLAVLYGLLGKPVVSYTYKVRTSSSSSGYDGYLTQHLEYDAAWCGSLLLLIIVLFCVFKAGGALLCKR